LTRR
jgi:hypothetical protein